MTKDKSNDKAWAVLSYLGALVFLPFLLKKDSKFVQFHTKQGLVILIGWVLVILPFGSVFGVLALICSIMGIIDVLSGKTTKMPLVGDLTEKIKGL